MPHPKYETVKISIDGKEMDFSMAKRLSEVLAAGSVNEPMLIAWFDGEKNEEHPSVPECQHKPG